MKISLFVIATVTVGLVIGVATGGLPIGSAPAQQPEASTAPAPLALYRRIPMPGVIGRLDHIGADTKRGRLIIAALGNDTAEIVDVNGMKVIHDIPGQTGRKALCACPIPTGSRRGRVYGAGLLRTASGRSTGRSSTDASNAVPRRNRRRDCVPSGTY